MIDERTMPRPSPVACHLRPWSCSLVFHPLCKDIGQGQSATWPLPPLSLRNLPPSGDTHERENRAGLEQGSVVGKARQAQTFEDVVVGRLG
jgi:hypothetical protein